MGSNYAKRAQTHGKTNRNPRDETIVWSDLQNTSGDRESPQRLRRPDGGRNTGQGPIAGDQR